jgi:hypothetical protein
MDEGSNSLDEINPLPTPPLGFLRNRSGSFDALSDAPLAAPHPKFSVPSRNSTAEAVGTRSSKKVPRPLECMPQQKAEVEEGCLEYKLLLAPETAGKKLHAYPRTHKMCTHY